jgi:glutathione S-transferase
MLRYRFYMHYAEGSLMPPLLVKLVLGKVPLLGGLAQKRIQPMIDVHLDFVENELASRPWFTGESFTAADIIMSFPLEAARDRGGSMRAAPQPRAGLRRFTSDRPIRPPYPTVGHIGSHKPSITCSRRSPKRPPDKGFEAVQRASSAGFCANQMT